MEDQFVVRRAVISDIDALSQLCHQTVRETYLEDLGISLSEEDLNSYFRTSATPEWFANKINDPNRAIWVIEDKTNGELAAYAIVGICKANEVSHSDVCPNKDGILNRLYVRRDRQGRGFGQQLMNVMLVWFEEHCPTRPVWVIVNGRNVKAENFYVHYGFEKVADFRYNVGKEEQNGCILKRPSHTN